MELSRATRKKLRELARDHLKTKELVRHSFGWIKKAENCIDVVSLDYRNGNYLIVRLWISKRITK